MRRCVLTKLQSTSRSSSKATSRKSALRRTHDADRQQVLAAILSRLTDLKVMSITEIRRLAHEAVGKLREASDGAV
jgi:hypothetical protein